MHKITSSEQEIQLYIKLDCSKSKKAIACAKSHSNNVSMIYLSKTRGTGTIWENILTKLQMSPKQLLDKSQPYYQENIKGRDFEKRDWINLLMNNPDLVRSPIVVRGKRAIFLDNPTDIYKI